MRKTFNREKFHIELHAAIKAKQAGDILRYLAKKEGIAFDAALGEQHLMSFDSAVDLMNFDAPIQADLVTSSNAGIPNIFTTWVDPKAIEILVSPMMAAVITGETQKASWEDDVAMFKVAEATGETSAYGDYSRSGSTDVNYNFPQRQNFLFQAFLQYGDREVARAAKAKIDLPADKQSANALALMKALNYMYFFGVGSLQNFGLLNDPNLLPAIQAQFSWLTSASATALTIYQDVVRLYTLLQTQSNGTVNTQTKMTLAMSNEQATALNTVTQYNTNSVLMLLKQNYPNLRLETAVEYLLPAGQLVQLIVDELDGQTTADCSFSTKMMAHRVIPSVSSIEQKRTSGGFGCIIYRPFLIAQMYA